MQNDLHRCPKCQASLPSNAPQGLCPKCLLAAAAIPTEIGRAALGDSPPPALETVAKAFPQLEILELVGQGGMGFIFKARQPKLDRLVALKILPQSLATDLSFAERFNREARLLARLSHPNIVTVHDFGQAGEFFYLLMEFVDGVNLRQAMKAGRFTPGQALAIVPKVCEALQFAHNEGILHRDIKPENILLDAKGRVKIADFGIAKLVGDTGSTRSSGSAPLELVGPQDDALTESGRVLGTPNYMAPEQLKDPQSVDHRADIYSLGVVFYEMLTGELPVGRFAPPSQKSAADPRVDQVVARALKKEKEKRFDSAEEVKTQVEMINTGFKGQCAQGRPSGRRRFFGLHLSNVEKILIIFAVGMLLTYSVNKMVSRDLNLGPPELDPEQLRALNAQPVLALFGKTESVLPSAEPPRFTPVMQETLRFSDMDLSYCFDLESNEIHEIRKGAHPANYRLPNGISLFDDHGNTNVFISAVGPVYMASLRPQRLESAEASQIIRVIEANANLRTNLITIASVSKRDLPATFLFWSRRGHAGAFEITSLADDQHAAQIRYKLIPGTSWNTKFQSVSDPLTGSKAISRESVVAFNRGHEFDMALARVDRENYPTVPQVVFLSIQSEESWNKFNELISGTPVEEPVRRIAKLREERELMDPYDRDKWEKIATKLAIAQFDRDRLMLAVGNDPSLAGTVESGRQFGLWIESTLLYPSTGRDCFLDLDSGTLLTPPADRDFNFSLADWRKVLSESRETNAAVRWILDSGADVVMANPPLILLCSMATTRIADPVLNPDWEQKITPAWVNWELDKQRVYLTSRSHEPIGALGSVGEFDPNGGYMSPNLCLFRTRRGLLGILQITRYTENPKGAVIRYKVVTPK